MKKSKRLIAAAGVLSVAVLAGCGGNASNSTEGTKSEQSASAESTKDELVFVNYRDIRDLNPHLYAGEMYAQEMLYETLVNITENGYEGCLAESWDISGDGKTYTFHIRDEVLFLYRGHITECRPVRELGKTTDEYARRLLQAIV